MNVVTTVRCVHLFSQPASFLRYTGHRFVPSFLTSHSPCFLEIFSHSFGYTPSALPSAQLFLRYKLSVLKDKSRTCNRLLCLDVGSNQQHLAQKTSSTIFSLLVQRRFYQAKENLIKQVHLIDTCLCHQVTCCMQTSLPQLPFLRRSRPCCRKYSVVSLSTTRLSPFLSSIPSVVLLHATTVFSKLVPP